MDYQIFKDEKEKIEARTALNELARHEGWKLVERAVQLNIEHFKDKLAALLRIRDNTGESFRVQDQIDTLEALRNLPAILIAEATDTPDEESDDIYDTPEPSPEPWSFEI